MFKKIITTLGVFVFVFMLIPLSALALERYEILKQGDKDEWVYELQEELGEKGFMSHYPTGYFGSITKSSVLAFQRDYGLSVDGVAGPQTRKALLGENYYAIPSTRFSSGNTTITPPVSTTVLRVGSAGDEVYKLQQRLDELGYYNYGRYTGYYGEITKSAVKAFQSKNGLTVDGIAGKNTKGVLYSGSAKAAEAKAAVNTFLATAGAQIGKPYVYGDEGPSTFDCSGFAYYSLNSAGVNEGRLNASMYSTYSSWSKISTADSLIKGDLVFFRSDSSSYISHMGIYLGNSEFIHASSGQGKIIISTLSNSYWSRNYMWAKRVF